MTTKLFYMDMQSTCGAFSLSESTLQKMIRENLFPQPRILSAKRVGWLVRELEDWAESRPVSDLLPPANTGAKKGATA